MSNNEKSCANRTRNWATIVYPESAPCDWLDKLADVKVPALVSPLHNRDVNANGEVKKDHYHVMLMFQSVKSQPQVKVIVASFGGVGTEYVQSQRGYARYLCHLDNPEKAQYEPKDVKQLCGAMAYSELVSSEADKKSMVKQMLAFCRDNGIYEFCDLAYYAMDEREDWYEVLASNPMAFVKETLRSAAYVNAKRGGKCNE